MIQRVYEQAKLVLDDVWVATDDERIEKAVKDFGGNVIITSTVHSNGTERCEEAAEVVSKLINKSFDIVINIQGDEPFIQKSQIRLAIDCFKDSETEISTVVQPINETEDILNPNLVKVVLSVDSDAVYFSRSPIPYLRDYETEKWINHHTFLGHIGLYAFRRETLSKLTKLPKGTLEKLESLEQLRWLENGYKIKTRISESNNNFGVDSPEDIEKIHREGLETFMIED
jgi:3-deoxy-manno-octulosonate cytidylyltransferase (CMP-KDO synthetase)